jgi:hypothetical protein
LMVINNPRNPRFFSLCLCAFCPEPVLSLPKDAHF